MTSNPYNFTRPVTDPKMFFGRWRLVEQLVNGLTSSSPSSFAVYGGRRTGKTSLLRMVERRLKERLAARTHPIVVPLYMDLQFHAPTSPTDFFQRLVDHLVTWQASVMDATTALPTISPNAPAPSFADAFCDLYRQVRPQLGGFRLALLIDESEGLQRPPWAHSLDDNLRALLSNVDGVSGHLALIMAGGASFYADMAAEQNGSPLRNVMDSEIKLPACPSADMLRLVNEPTNGRVAAHIANEVVQQAGGHLFLGQFLMRHLWEDGLQSADIELVQEIASDFPEKRRDYESWYQAIGQTGRRAYAVLAEQNQPLSRPQLSKGLNLDPITVAKALDPLIYHGLIEVKRRKYSWRGKMFYSWFCNNSLHSFTSAPPPDPPSVKPEPSVFSFADQEATDTVPTSKTSLKPTIGLITALPKEFAATRVMLDNAQRHHIPDRGGSNLYFQGQIPASDGGQHDLILALMSDMGTNPAAVLATRLLGHFPTIKDIIMVGIAGGVPHPEKPDEHVRLGDVVVSDRNGVVQYDFDKESVNQITHRHPLRPPSARLLGAVKLLEANRYIGEYPWLEHIERASHMRNTARPPEKTDILTDSNEQTVTISHADDPNRVAGQPRVFTGRIASANKLLKNPLKRDELRRKFGVKAIEMEGSGIADATWNDSVGYLVVRGICDYCDSNKNDLWQEYAAVVAAAYTRALLESMPQ